LEGLEISIVPLSEAMASAITRRIDPEYFQKQYLADQTLVRSRAKSFQSFARLGLAVDGSAFYPAIEEYYGTGELPFLRVADVDSVIDFENCLRIPSELCNRFPTLARVHDGDIVLTKGGSVARVGLVTEEAAASRDLIFLNSSILSNRDRLFLYIYAQTAFFNRQLLRSSSQTAQPHLTITLVRNLPTFRAGNDLKSGCAKLVEMAYTARAEALAKGKQAEAILTSALGLAEWEPSEPLTYTARASLAFAARRLDSEYFAPRVADLINRLSSGERCVRDAAPPRRERFAPSGNGTFRYMEISDLRSDGSAITEVVPMQDAPSRATWYARKGDLVTSTVRPNRRLSALVSPEQDGCVASSGFVVRHRLCWPVCEVVACVQRVVSECLHRNAGPKDHHRDKVAGKSGSEQASPDARNRKRGGRAVSRGDWYAPQSIGRI
jgi:hypothetical protein